VRFQSLKGEPRVCTNSIIFFWSSLVCFCAGALIVAIGAWVISSEPAARPQFSSTAANTTATTPSVDKPIPGIDAKVASSPASRSPEIESGTRPAGKNKPLVTELLPPIFGYQLKLTDALVILSGFLLFFATFALYLATRSLVKSADKNAQTQLRAYVSVVPTSISTINPFSVALCFKNHGPGGRPTSPGPGRLKLLHP
jgi:hypothetical protein